MPQTPDLQAIASICHLRLIWANLYGFERSLAEEFSMKLMFSMYYFVLFKVVFLEKNQLFCFNKTLKNNLFCFNRTLCGCLWIVCDLILIMCGCIRMVCGFKILVCGCVWRKCVAVCEESVWLCVKGVWLCVKGVWLCVDNGRLWVS